MLALEGAFGEDSGVVEIIMAILGIVLINFMPFFYAGLLYKKRDELEEEGRNFARYSALYAEVRVNKPEAGDIVAI